MTPYVGPTTMRVFFPFYTYGPKQEAVLVWSWHVRFRLWLATIIAAPFVWVGPQPEDPSSWQPKWKGDCVTYAFLLRRICELLGMPVGALRLAYCTTGQQPGDWSKGHMVLTAETTAGCLACDVVKRTWASWDSYGYHDWNREAV